jgi:diguanylate cyclase (GGDEF)-like protein
MNTITPVPPAPAASLPQPPGPAPLQAALSALLSAVLAQRGDLLAVKDGSTGRYLHVDDAMAAFIGRPAAEVLGRTDAELFDPPIVGALRAADHTAMAQSEPLVSDHRHDWHGGRRDFSVLRMASTPDAHGRRLLCSVWHDPTQERQQQAQLRTALEQIEQQQRAYEALRREVADQGLRDPASGLYSRAHFEDQLRREVDLSTREHREFALVFIDIDPPVDAVRQLGAAGHNQVLEAMGRLLRGGTRAMDASCRIDEGRFAVLLSGVGLATAHARMEGLRRKCATQIVMHAGQVLGFSVAMGVASFPHTAQTRDDLIAACNAALAEARRRGGNHVTLAAIKLDPSSGQSGPAAV